MLLFSFYGSVVSRMVTDITHVLDELAVTQLALPVDGHCRSHVWSTSPTKTTQMSETVGRSTDVTNHMWPKMTSDWVFWYFPREFSKNIKCCLDSWIQLLNFFAFMPQKHSWWFPQNTLKSTFRWDTEILQCFSHIDTKLREAFSC